MVREVVELVAAGGEDPKVVLDSEEEEELHVEEELTGEVRDSVLMEGVAIIDFELAFCHSPEPCGGEVTIYFQICDQIKQTFPLDFSDF